MPELPEVETTRRHLSDAIVGKTFVEVSITHPRTARHNGGEMGLIESRLTGRRVSSVDRHGKFLVLPLDDGMTMVAHLGMSGRFITESEPFPAHTHFAATMDDGSMVGFVDPRTFGFVAVFDDVELGESGLSRLGPDAWDEPPTAEQLADKLSGRTAPIKALLLDQVPISGLGNIYADEALFLAGIDPRTPAGSISVEAFGPLVVAIQEVLEQAITHGGTSLGDLTYLLPDGRAGENLGNLKVYGRAGEACYRCGEIIDRVVIRARSSHFCPGCQVGHDR